MTLSDINRALREKTPLQFDETTRNRVARSHAYLQRTIREKPRAIYGINTGFGYLQNVVIADDKLEALQYNLLKSHACGLGEEVPKDIVRLMLLFKIEALCQGYSGVQVETVERLMDFYNHDILPVVFAQGSLGASGDLAPLSHLALPLIGLGEVWFEGKRVATSEVLAHFGWSPIRLRAKEGLALINGTQFMSAYGAYLLIQAFRLWELANKIGALSLEAFDGRTEPFHEAIHAIRPHEGQVRTAKMLRELLHESEIAEQTTKQVQDPYSFRCMPQVHGASWDVFRYAESVFMTEINAVTDNPNIFCDDDLILSGGNFHGQPLAMSLDFLAIALSELGSISERRTFQLLSGQRGLPLFLAKESGLNSGLMIPQYTAAGIASENKQLCTPASVDTIPSSNGQEDHVSMGANAATKCFRVLQNVEKLLAIELLCAAQAFEFRRPLRTSEPLEALFTAFRQEVSFNDADRILATDMNIAIRFIQKTAD